MQNIKLIGIYFITDPENEFVVCDVNENRDFVDPLLLLENGLNAPVGINPKGLYALGGEINADTMEKAYKWGIFPWYAYKESKEVEWYCPEERFVIYPERIHVSHSLRSLLNKNRYSITVNKCFEEVIHNCRYVNNRDEMDSAWLNDNIEKSFVELYKRGFAKSVEVWENGELAGGFYGFFYNGVFEGDSMFSFRPSASQVGLIKVCSDPFIEGKRIKLIDTQFETPTFKKLGGEYISYRLYREMMEK